MNRRKDSEASLIKAGYTIKNAVIQEVDIVVEGICVKFKMQLKTHSKSFIVTSNDLGSYEINRGFCGDSDSTYYAMCYADIMNIIGVDKLRDLFGKYVRLVINDDIQSIVMVGNIIDDYWCETDSLHTEVV